ncbi:hypothetical protein EU528_13465, partial [Candidatus Thorarchaeota archaeon]
MERDCRSAYDELLQFKRDIYLYESGWSSITWDSLTTLPLGARNQRTEVMGILGKTYQRMVSNPKIGELLNHVLKSPDFETFDAIQKRNIYLIEKQYAEYRKLPEDYMARFMKQMNVTRQKWVEAKEKNDWMIVESEFEKMFSIMIEKAEYLMDAVGVSNPYDYHFNWWEEGMSASVISKIFAQLTKALRPMIIKYAPQTDSIRTDFLTRPVSKELQRMLAESLAKLVGYDIKSESAVGLIGETMHPFSIGRYDDVRIALRFIEDYPLDSYRCTLHECGHALYKINLDRALMYQPVGMEAGFGIDESQAKFLEYMIGFSPE